MINLNIYIKELKRNRKTGIVWTISLSALITFFMSFYPMIMESKILLETNQLFNQPYFKNMMDALGMNFENLTNVLGFYVSYSGLYIVLLGCIFSIQMSSKIVSIEEYEKTAEFLLSKPVTRREVMNSKLLAILSYVTILNFGIILAAFISIEIHKTTDYSFSTFMIMNLYVYLLMLSFGAIGLFISLLIKRGRATNGITIGIVVGTYFFNAFSRLGEATEFIGYISPFKYINSNVLAADYHLEFSRVAFFLGIILIMTTASYVVYRKKDILV